MDLCLEGRVVLVTGSTRGLGKAIATRFLKEGAHVVVSGVDTDRAQRTADELSQGFGSSRVLLFAGDLTKADVINRCVQVALDRFERIDVLVANVGSGRGTAGWRVADEEWSNMMNLNFVGARRITDVVVPHMLERNSGSIVYVSSIAGREVIGAPIHYSVAKASLIAYAKNLSRKLAGSNIRVNAVCPGNIYIEGGTWDSKLRESRQEVTEMLKNSVPLNRFARPEEIADLVLFLASERASFMSGSCVVIDGGQTVSL